MIQANFPIPPAKTPSPESNRYNFFVGVFPVLTLVLITNEIFTTIFSVINHHIFTDTDFYRLFAVFWMFLALYFWSRRAHNIINLQNSQNRVAEMEQDLAVLETIMTRIDPEILKEKGILMEKIKIPKKH